MYFPFLNPTMVISRQKLNGLGEHLGVQLPDGQVAHYTAERNLCITSIEEFAQNKDVKVVRVIPTHTNNEVFQRLDQIRYNPRPYHITDWNCEIFANWLTGEKPVSKQVAGWGLLGLIAGVAILSTQA